jgi:hypothetical protein
MDLLLLLLGALLAVGGGLLAQRQEQILRRQREEEDVLLEANDALLDLHAVLSQTDYQEPEVIKEQPTRESVERIGKLLDIRDRLSKLAVRLKRSEHRDIAVRLTKLALDRRLRTKENVYAATRAVQIRLNPKMIQQYEREISTRPEDF